MKPNFKWLLVDLMVISIPYTSGDNHRFDTPEIPSKKFNFGKFGEVLSGPSTSLSSQESLNTTSPSPLKSPQTREKGGLQVRCGEIKMRITAKREFFQDRSISFLPAHLRLGEDPRASGTCTPVFEDSVSEMVISAELQDCGSESIVIGDWLIYSNKLVFSPGTFPTFSSLIVRAVKTVIPIECHYKRKQRVSGDPLTPTWLPMISTISAYGLLHFSLRIMEEDWSSPRTSTLFQQGETVFLEASVEAPLHPPLRIYVDYCVATLNSDPLSIPSYKFIAKHGCLVDSVVHNSSSQFFPRERENALRFSIQAFHFRSASEDPIFINCNLRATLLRNPPDRLNKACSFHGPSFSWHATEGDRALCQCCDSEDCFQHTAVKTDRHSIHRTQLETAEEEANTTVGPLHTLPNSYWIGHLSVIPPESI